MAKFYLLLIYSPFMLLHLDAEIKTGHLYFFYPLPFIYPNNHFRVVLLQTPINPDNKIDSLTVNLEVKAFWNILPALKVSTTKQKISKIDITHNLQHANFK